jgi:diguanylate cyclase (GGDEF)-like protein
MTVNQDILLPLLVAAIVINTVVMAGVVIAGQLRKRRLAGASRPNPVDAVMAASYLERSARLSATPAPQAEAEVEAAPPAAEPDPFPDAAAATAAAAAADAIDHGAADAEPDGLDAETGLLDAGAFHRLIVQEDGRLRRYHRPATVVVIDLDGLERLTETLGPKAAERVVAAMADAVRRLARGADHVARLEAGRFGVLLPETDEIAAINYVERVRRASELWLESGAIAIRLAIGWAGTAGEPSLPDTQQLALERMYAELRREARRADPAVAPTLVSPDPEAKLAS